MENNLAQKNINRFFNSLEATMDKNGTKYTVFPDYDDDWQFSDYYNNNTKEIGLKKYRSRARESGKKPQNNFWGGGEKIFTRFFNFWEDFYFPKKQGGNPPPPP